MRILYERFPTTSENFLLYHRATKWPYLWGLLNFSSRSYGTLTISNFVEIRGISEYICSFGDTGDSKNSH